MESKQRVISDIDEYIMDDDIADDELSESELRVRAMVKLSAAFFHDESSITKGGYESAIAPKFG